MPVWGVGQVIASDFIRNRIPWKQLLPKEIQCYAHPKYTASHAAYADHELKEIQQRLP